MFFAQLRSCQRIIFLVFVLLVTKSNSRSLRSRNCYHLLQLSITNDNGLRAIDFVSFNPIQSIERSFNSRNTDLISYDEMTNDFNCFSCDMMRKCERIERQCRNGNIHQGIFKHNYCELGRSWCENDVKAITKKIQKYFGSNDNVTNLSCCATVPNNSRAQNIPFLNMKTYKVLVNMKKELHFFCSKIDKITERKCRGSHYI